MDTNETLTPESEVSVLRCSVCGLVTDRIHTARHNVRSLSRGKTVRVGDPLCDRCHTELQEELTEEEELRGPA